MSVLLKEISSISREAVSVLKKADFCTDSDIQSLTREDLRELFPEAGKLKLRRNIFEIIHKQKPVDVLIKELKGFIPHESLRAALTNNGVLVDYLRILKDMKTQMNCVQSFLDAHIGLLEEIRKNQPDQESDRDSLSGTTTPARSDPAELCNGQTAVHQQAAQDSLSGTAASHTSGQMVHCPGSTGDHPHRSQNSLSGTAASHTSGQMVLCPGSTGDHPHGSQSTGASYSSDPVVLHTDPASSKGLKMKCQMIVSGKTFHAHEQLMNKVMGQGQDGVQLQVIESRGDYQITIVFCPICSRIASDVEAAMSDVKDDKPVILVLMHHTHEVKCTTPMRTWLHDSKVVLHVNVFYHETAHGLLKCPENDVAASEIRRKLLEYSKGVSGKSLGGVSESGRTGSTPPGGAGNNRGSDLNSRGNLFTKFHPSSWLS